MYCAFWKFCIPIMILLFVFCLSPFSASLFHSSCAFAFSQRSFPFLPFFSFPISQFPVFPSPLFVLSFTLFVLPFYISASLHHHSDSFLLCFTLLHGQVAEQLAYYVHVSETVITEETFDAAVQFGSVQGNPTQCWAGWPVCMPPWLPSAPTGKRASRTTVPPTCSATSSASQVGTSAEEKETVHRQTTLN